MLSLDMKLNLNPGEISESIRGSKSIQSCLEAKNPDCKSAAWSINAKQKFLKMCTKSGKANNLRFGKVGLMI